MSKQEFLKKAVRNMDRDVEYEYPISGRDRETNHSDIVKETGPINFYDGDTEGK
jgi:hypothetical protein